MKMIAVQCPRLHPLFPERSLRAAANTTTTQAAGIDANLILATAGAPHMVATESACAALEHLEDRATRVTSGVTEEFLELFRRLQVIRKYMLGRRCFRFHAADH